MKVFICNKTTDADSSNMIVNELMNHSGNAVAVLREENHSENWKQIVESKLQEVDFVLFVLGENTFESDAIKWEYAKSKQLNKRIVGLKLENASPDTVLFCQGFQIFDDSKQCLSYLIKTFEDDRRLLLEQYKIMVSSTEKVTEQRSKVNSLFFTVVSSILSLSLVVGKTFDFSFVGMVGMMFFTAMAFMASFFWEKLVRSYGKLNTGKFKVIDGIEKQLRTNMFEREWKILGEIGYESNTETELGVVRQFRWFIISVGIIEFTYIFARFFNLYCSRN